MQVHDRQIRFVKLSQSLPIEQSILARLFIDALWSPAGKGLNSWLSLVMSNYEDYYSTDLNSPRHNMDTNSKNKCGRFLLDLCKESCLKLLNGRCMGDIFGNFTYYTYNGYSLVDYAAMPAHMHCKIAKFQKK